MITYEDQLKDWRWREFRSLILRRDGNKCQECGRKDKLNVHHKRYLEGRLAWEYPSDLLITLCEGCHKKEHGIETEDQYQRSGRIIASAAQGILGIMMKIKEMRK